MPQRIEVPGMGVVEFPDGMSDDQIASAIKANMPKAAPSASPLGSDFENFRAGVGRGLYSLASGAKQRLDEAAAALEGAIPGGAKLSQMLGGQTAAQIRDQGQALVTEQRRLDAPLMNTKAGIGGDILGNIAGASLAAPAGAVASGMAMGYLTPTTENESVLKNTALGGALSYAGDKAIRGVSRMISPKPSAEVASLAEQGIKMTPGQILGGAFSKAEEKATSLPIVGDAIANARRRSAESLNRVAINRALEPIGEKLPKNMPLGRQAIEYTDDALGKAYDNILPKLNTQADNVFVSEIQQLRGMVASGNMGPAEAQQFDKILKNQVLGKFQGQASITGETMKQMESELGRLGNSYMRDMSADKRQLGGAILELQSSLRGLVQRSNPQYAEELKAINTGWANFKRVQRAAAGVGAEDGIFSPAQLQNAVKALDKSKDKGRFAKGDALMQDLSDPAKSVLGSSVPDSGTPGRLMNAGAIASGVYNPGIPAGLLGASALYSDPVLSLIQKAMLNRPAGATALADKVLLGAPYAGLLGAYAAPQIGQ